MPWNLSYGLQNVGGGALKRELQEIKLLPEANSRAGARTGICLRDCLQCLLYLTGDWTLDTQLDCRGRQLIDE